MRPQKPIIITGILLVLGIGAISVYAQTASELQDKISQSNSEIRRLEEEIAAANRTLIDIAGQKNTLSNEIKKLDLTQSTLTKQISLTETKIKATDLLIGELSGEISNKHEIIGEQRDAISSGLRTIHARDEEPVIVGILADGKLSEAWKDVDQILALATSLRRHIEELNDVKKMLEVDRDEQELAKEELVLLRKDLANQKANTVLNKKQKDTLLAQTKNKESEYQKLLAEKTARKAAFEKEINDYESQLKFILDPNSLPRSGSTALSWPLDNVYVTQYFGATVAAKRLYVTGSHNGMDFRAPLGTRVLASASGTIIGVGDTDPVCPGASYGKWVLIKHSNGLSTVYGHLSSITVSEGQQVRMGQVVAYSGSSGYSTGPHLHLSVFAANGVEVKSLASKACSGRTYRIPIAATNAYLDPMLYLPPISTR